MKNLADIWSEVLVLIKADLLPVSYKTWIETIVPVDMDDEKILLQVPNEYNMTMLLERYMDLLKNSILYATNKEYEIEIRVKEDIKPVIKEEKISSPSPVSSFYTFDNFIIGESNEVAHANIQAAVKACVEGTHCDYNPLFIFGNAGLGKTHLMHAAEHKILTESKNEKNVLYVTSEQFTNEFINSIKENDNEKFREKYRSVDVLMIDDIQFISNMMAVQKEFHHTFNDLIQGDKIIIISGDRPPKEIHGVEERLITRFESGVMCEIQSPDFETRIAILKKKAEQLNIEIDEEIYRFIANIITTSNRELEGAMKKLVSLHKLMKKEITISLAREVTKDFNNPVDKKITTEMIISTVEKHFNLNDNSLKSNSRSKNISYPRQIAMYIIKEVMDKKLIEIGNCFGGKDHSTVIHAISKIESDIKNDPTTKAMIEDIIKDIKNWFINI